MRYKKLLTASYDWWYGLTPEERKDYCKAYYPAENAIFVSTDINWIRKMYCEMLDFCKLNEELGIDNG